MDPEIIRQLADRMTPKKNYMIKTSVLFAFAAMLAWGVGDFLIQRTVKRVGNLVSVAWLSIVGSVGLFPFVIKYFYQLESLQALFLLFVVGILLTVDALFLGESLKRGKLSVMEVVLMVELPLTILMGVAFLNDQLSLSQVVLIGIIFVGVMFSSVDFRKIRTRHFLEKGVLLALAGATFLAMMNFFTAVNAKQISPLLAIWFPWTVASCFTVAYLYFKKEMPAFMTHGKEFGKLIILTGLIDVAAWVFYAFAVSKGELSITTAITESYPIIAILLGIRINQEKVTKFQFAGGIAAIGVSVILGLTQ